MSGDLGYISLGPERLREKGERRKKGLTLSLARVRLGAPGHQDNNHYHYVLTGHIVSFVCMYLHV